MRRAHPALEVGGQLQCRGFGGPNHPHEGHLVRGADAPLRIGFVRAAALGCLFVTGVGLIAQPLVHAGTVYPWKAASLFAAMMAVTLVFLGEHPFPRLGPANYVTIVRATLVALAAGLIGEPVTPRIAGTAVTMTAAVAVLDGIDGWLARRSRMASPFGARFDMETDALVILALSVLVWRHDKAGVWVLACGLMRYAFVAAGWLLPWVAGPLAPTRRGKTVAIAQVVGLNLALLPVIPSRVSTLIAGVTLAALTWSFAVDISRLWRQRAT